MLNRCGHKGSPRISAARGGRICCRFSSSRYAGTRVVGDGQPVDADTQRARCGTSDHAAFLVCRLHCDISLFEEQPEAVGVAPVLPGDPPTTPLSKGVFCTPSGDAPAAVRFSQTVLRAPSSRRPRGGRRGHVVLDMGRGGHRRRAGGGVREGQASGSVTAGETTELTLNIASKGETLTATRTTASSGEATPVAGGARRPCPTGRPLRQAATGLPPEHRSSGLGNSRRIGRSPAVLKRAATSTTIGLVRIGGELENLLTICAQFPMSKGSCDVTRRTTALCTAF